MKRRGIFAIATILYIAARDYLKDVFTPDPTLSVGAYRGEGRQAFESISAPRCHTQKRKRSWL